MMNIIRMRPLKVNRKIIYVIIKNLKNNNPKLILALLTMINHYQHFRIQLDVFLWKDLAKKRASSF